MFCLPRRSKKSSGGSSGGSGGSSGGKNGKIKSDINRRSTSHVSGKNEIAYAPLQRDSGNSGGYNGIIENLAKSPEWSYDRDEMQYKSLWGKDIMDWDEGGMKSREDSSEKNKNKYDCGSNNKSSWPKIIQLEDFRFHSNKSHQHEHITTNQHPQLGTHRKDSPALLTFQEIEEPDITKSCILDNTPSPSSPLSSLSSPEISIQFDFSKLTRPIQNKTDVIQDAILATSSNLQRSSNPPNPALNHIGLDPIPIPEANPRQLPVQDAYTQTPLPSPIPAAHPLEKRKSLADENDNVLEKPPSPINTAPSENLRSANLRFTAMALVAQHFLEGRRRRGRGEEEKRTEKIRQDSGKLDDEHEGRKAAGSATRVGSEQRHINGDKTISKPRDGRNLPKESQPVISNALLPISSQIRGKGPGYSEEGNLEKDVSSLQVVLQIRQDEIRKLRQITLSQELEIMNLRSVKETNKLLSARLEDLQAQVDRVKEERRSLQQKCLQTENNYTQVLNHLTKLEFDNEQLKWCLHSMNVRETVEMSLD